MNNEQSVKIYNMVATSKRRKAVKRKETAKTVKEPF